MSKIITLEELKKHTTGRDLWFSIHDKVYDVTKFIEEHPGGEEVLLEQGGHFATEIFEDVGHSDDARELMIQYQVGEMAQDDKESKKSKVKTKPNAPEGGSENSFSSWLFPLGIAIAAAILYRFVISSQNN